MRRRDSIVLIGPGLSRRARGWCGILFSAFFPVLLPSAAQSACVTWDAASVWGSQQSNVASNQQFYLHPTKAGFEGTAGYVYFDKNRQLVAVNGPASGAFRGDEVKITVYWDNGTTGVYSGSIDPQGRVTGTTYDAKNPQSVARWTAGPLRCLTSAGASPSPASNEPPNALGKVKLPETSTPVSICEAARSARARNSPAAPGLEAQCRALGAAGQLADLTVTAMTGPGSLKPGLSGTFTVSIKNSGSTKATVELGIIFAGKLDQTGQIVAGAGLSCVVVHDAGINAALRCTGGQLGTGETANVTVQGRGQVAGAGTLVATIHASRSVKESSYDNNTRQLNLTIN